MSNVINSLSKGPEPESRSDVMVLKYETRFGQARPQAMRLMTVWLSFCFAFIVGISAVLGIAG